MLPDTLIVWSHALAALLFGALALAQYRQPPVPGLPGRALVAALGATAFWALAFAGIGPAHISTRLAETLRNLGWLAVMFTLVEPRLDRGRRAAVSAIYALVACLAIVGALLAIPQSAAVPPMVAEALEQARLVLRMMVAAGALVLVHHLYTATDAAHRAGPRIVAVALATLWGADLLLFALSWAQGSWSSGAVAVRGIVVAALAPVLAVAVHRSDAWDLRLSRTVFWQAIIVVAGLLYIGAMVLVTAAIEDLGGAYVRALQTAFVFGSTTALLTLVSSPWTRAWAKVKLAKHLSRHRYDYRAEWIRFTDTLARPGDEAVALDRRIVKAVADLTDSPAGMLLIVQDDALLLACDWRWPGPPPPETAAGAPLAHSLAETGRIVEIDQVRAGQVSLEEAATIPSWITDCAEAWALVPLLHFGKLIGAILLARPPIDRALDWEDFDLLRIAGRQVASYLAEARAHAALDEAERFDEFNRRFAFIMHDIKNLVSQLNLVARNAERHADNPAFRADMVATLKDSAGRMTELLARLSQQQPGRAESPRPTLVFPLVERLVARRRGDPTVRLSGDHDACACVDAARLEQLLGHLIQNAVEASPPDAIVAVQVEQAGDEVAIDITDRGTGMSAAFVRDKLFRPFVSSKPGGFGIGAYEARQLALAMGGRIDVHSREGDGTRFHVVFARADAPVSALEEAA